MPVSCPASTPSASRYPRRHPQRSRDRSPLWGGNGGGTFTQGPGLPDLGNLYELRGSAVLTGLGSVMVQGSVRALGQIENGHAGGELTFAGTRGLITVDLLGPSQPSFSPLPHQFTYRVTVATGAFRHLSVQGSLQLILTPAASERTLSWGHQHGTFTLII